MKMYHADSRRAAAEVTAAKPASPMLWCGVVSYVVLLCGCVIHVRVRMRRDFLTFPMHESDWRVGSKISVFSTVWSSWKSLSKNLGLKRRCFNCIRTPVFVSDRKPTVAIHVSDCVRTDLMASDDVRAVGQFDTYRSTRYTRFFCRFTSFTIILYFAYLGLICCTKYIPVIGDQG